MKDFEQWHGFHGTKWRDDIDTRDFIHDNYTPYDGDESFLRDRQKQQTSFGASSRNCRKKSAQKAAFSIWTHMLLQA